MYFLVSYNEVKKQNKKKEQINKIKHDALMRKYEKIVPNNFYSYLFESADSSRNLLELNTKQEKEKKIVIIM